MALIHKIEALSDWLQSPPERRKHIDIAFGVIVVLGVLWGIFFVPQTILLDSSAARVWVSVATTIFPWLTQLESNWGAAAHKALYLHSVFYLVGAFPVMVHLLSNWEVRTHDRKKLRAEITDKGFLQVVKMLASGGVLTVGSYFVPKILTYNSSPLLYFFLYPYFTPIAAFTFACLTWFLIVQTFLKLLYLAHSRDIKPIH